MFYEELSLLHLLGIIVLGLYIYMNPAKYVFSQKHASFIVTSITHTFCPYLKQKTDVWTLSTLVL